MSEQFTQRKNRFYTTDAFARFDDDDTVGRVSIDLAETDAELRLYPRIEEIQPIEKEGTVVGQKEVERKPSWNELAAWMRDLIKNSDQMDEEEYAVIEGTARVNKYDDGGVMYQMFDDMIDADSFDVSIEKVSRIDANPEVSDSGNSESRSEDSESESQAESSESDEDSDDDIAEDFVNDQTNIDTDDEEEDEEEDDGEEEILFGED